MVKKSKWILYLRYSMKIQIESDLHLEFEQYFPKVNAEILILAGDIVLFDSLKPEKQLFQRFLTFFKFISDNYKKVFYVAGNHEYYKSTIDGGKNYFKDFLLDYNLNVCFLDNSTENYEGYNFIGSTLWTDCNKEDHLTMLHLKQTMNDFKSIRIASKGYRKFLPEDMVKEHYISKQYLDKALSSSSNNIVITHHAPTSLSIPDRYKSDYLTNGGYQSDLSEMILDKSPILWCHGHTHNKSDYMVGRTRVINNPKGYPSENFIHNSLTVEV